MEIDAVVVSSVLALCTDIGTPRALAVKLLIEHREWDQLVSLKTDPDSYFDAQSYYKDVVITDLLRKCEDLPTTIDRKAAAIKNFWLSESECYKSNRRLLPYTPESSLQGEQVPLIAEILRLARWRAGWLLGSRPTFREDGKFGPGSTYADRGKLVTVPDKMTSQPTTTSWKIPVRWGWTATAWASACVASPSGSHVVEVRGNRFTTVPKDATKDRGICIEPSLNVFYQLALGSEMKKRLSRRGLDLSIAQPKHKRVACEASRNGELATIDLTNASDTVCRVLPRILLPYEWARTLEDHRSPTTEIEGVKNAVVLQKFSSMGNGFTFELETTIFFCLVAAVYDHFGVPVSVGDNLLVFGDDIICRTDLFKPIIQVLRFFGFTPNLRKTFSTGPFRESCGGDYFSGMDVRPYYLEELPKNASDLIGFANGLARVRKNFQAMGEDSNIGRRSWFMVLDHIPRDMRQCRGPEVLGDVVIHDAPEYWTMKVKDSIRYVRAYIFTPVEKVKWEHWRSHVILAAALYGSGDGRRKLKANPVRGDLDVDTWDCGGVTPRDPNGTFCTVWIPFS